MSGQTPPSPNSQPEAPPLPSYISSQASNNSTSLPTATPLPSYILSQGSNIPISSPIAPPLPDYISNVPISKPIAPALPSYITPQRSNIATSQQSACMLPSHISASQSSKISKNSTTQNELDSIQSMKEDFPSTSSPQSSLGSLDFGSHTNEIAKIEPNLANITGASTPPPPPPPPTTPDLNTQMDSLQMGNHLNPINTSTELKPISGLPPAPPPPPVGMDVCPGKSESNTMPSTEKASSSTSSATQSSGSDLVSQIVAKSKNLRKTSNNLYPIQSSTEVTPTSCNSDTPAPQDMDVCPKKSSNEVIPTSHDSGEPPPPSQGMDVRPSKSESNAMPSTEGDSSPTLSTPKSSRVDFQSQIKAKSKNLRKTSTNLYPIQSSTELTPISCSSDTPPQQDMDVFPKKAETNTMQSKENNPSSTFSPQQSPGSDFESLIKHEMLSRRESMNQNGSDDDATSEDWEHVDE